MKDIFKQNLNLLVTLFGENPVYSKLDRLKEIFISTESSWTNNIERFRDKPIKYILLGEAAPWSENGIPRYFYNQIESKFHRSIWNAFFPSFPIPKEGKNSYEMLANEGFLLIDTLPYAMDYSGKRNKSSYYNLINSSVNWWTRKLQHENLILAKDIKVSFAFKINGLTLIDSLDRKLKLKNGNTIILNEDLIAADGSGYTNSQKLRDLYFSV